MLTSDVMAAPHGNLSFLAYRTLLNLRGASCSFPLSRYLCSSSVKDGREEADQEVVVSRCESGDVLTMLRGVKGRESRHKRTLQLRKNRRDADLEKKARTGQCMWRRHTHTDTS